jgi:hypothetical protein
MMQRSIWILSVVSGLGLTAVLFMQPRDAMAQDGHDALVAKHAAANGVPEHLVRRVIKIESRGNPRVISKGNFGLMQIRLGTARAMGYRGDANGLLDADTNMTYAVKYLAGAYRAAGGNADRAVSNYQRGYYQSAKRQGFSPYQQVAAQGSVQASDNAPISPDVRPAKSAGTPLSLFGDAFNGDEKKNSPRKRKPRQAKAAAPVTPVEQTP